MNETKKYIGVLEGAEVKKVKLVEGKKQKHQKYTIGNRVFWGFLDVDNLMQKEVLVTYKENPNKLFPDNPFKNVVSITLTTEQDKKSMPSAETYEEEEISDEQLDNQLEESGKELVTQGKEEKIYPSEQPQFFGMIANQTVDTLLCMEARYTKEGVLTEKFIEDGYSQIFDLLWNQAIKKRKEKLGY